MSKAENLKLQKLAENVIRDIYDVPARWIEGWTVRWMDGWMDR
jgi:hypothetical protein